MIENIIYALPFLILLLGILLIILFRSQENGLNHNFKIARITLLLSFAFSVIFYNKSFADNIAKCNMFSLLFQIVTYLTAIGTLFLSRKWFAGMNHDTTTFCIGLLMVVLFANAMIISQDLLFTGLGVWGLMAGNYVLLKNADKNKDIYLSSAIYGKAAVVFAFFWYFAVLLLWIDIKNLSYESVYNYINTNQDMPYLYLVIVLMILTYIFLLGLAPFHYWQAESMGQVILPVFTCFSVVPLGAVLASFIRINTVVLAPYAGALNIFYSGIALLSVVVGALGSCSGKNIRKLFAYASVYHVGLTLLIMISFSKSVVSDAFIYLFTYLISMYGLCSSLYGIKSRGEYLFTFNDISGAAYKKPYLSAIMTIFLFSLIGFPPFLGFLSTFSAMQTFLVHNHYWILFVVLCAMLMLSYAYLQIVKTLYFEDSNNVFDRAEKEIYFLILLNALIMVLIMVKPRYLVQDLDIMLEAVFE